MYIPPPLFEKNKEVLEQFIYDMRVQQNKRQNDRNACIEELQQRMPNIDYKVEFPNSNPFIIKKFLEKIDLSTLNEISSSHIVSQCLDAVEFHIHPTQEEISQYILDINSIIKELQTTYTLSENEITDVINMCCSLHNNSSSKILQTLLSLKEDKILLNYDKDDWGLVLLTLSSGGTIELLNNLRKNCSEDRIDKLCTFNKEIISKLNTLSENELTLVINLPELNSDPYFHLQETFTSIFSSKEKSSFYISILKKCSSKKFKQIFPHIEPIFEHLHTPNLPVNAVLEESYEKLKSFLSAKESFAIASAIPSIRNTVAYFYLAEEAGELGNIASSLPLSKIPIDPLSRLLSSKPFPEIKVWLEETNSQTNTRRVETLTLEQRNIILMRFPRYESNLPVQEWMDFFHVTEEEARAICSLPECTITADGIRLAFEEGNDSVKGLDLDVNDRQSWTNPSLLPSSQSFPLFIWLLCAAKRESICGAREVLSWGNGNFSSLCSAGNSVPLYARIDGNPVSLYQRNMLGDFQFPVYAAALQRKLINLVNTDLPAIISPSFSMETLGEIGFELLRLEKYFKEMYPQKTNTLKDFPLSTLDPDSPESRLEGHHKIIYATSDKRSLLPLLKEAYQDILGEFCELYPHKGYDRNNQSHRLAISFASMLFLFRTASATFSENAVDIDLAQDCSYHLKFLPGNCEIRIEDNPCVKDADREMEKQKFEDFVSDYSTHTLSPLTPNRSFPPQMCVDLIQELQGLEAKTFYAMCLSCFSLISDQADPYADGPTLFEKWQKLWPEGVSLSLEAKTLLLQLVKQYVVSVDAYSPPLTPGAKIAFDQNGANTYVHESLVPEFIRCEGNYASALCDSFTIHDTILHDGSCGINAFFSALNGPQEYSGPDGAAKIQGCVHSFRKAVVDYAIQHKTDFPEEYKEEIDRTIGFYNDATQTEFTGSFEWLCASQIFGREIRIYSRSEGDFIIDTNCKVAPAAIFRPTEEPKGPPINIMLYGRVHYCALIPRE